MLCCWGCLFVFIIGFLVSVLNYIDITYTHVWDGTRALGDLLYILPAAILFTGAVQIGAAWYARGTDLRAFSKSILIYSVVYILVALIGGLLGLQDSGLILAPALALLAQLITLIYFFKYPTHNGQYSLPRFCSCFKKHINVATTATGVTFVNTLSLTAPIFLLSQIYSVSDLGIYALMTRLLTTPLSVLTKSLSISFWSRAAELGRENKLEEMLRLYKRVCMLMLLPALLVVVVCFIGSNMIVPFLGEKWGDAGAVLLAIIPYLIGMAVASPTNHLWVIEKQGYQFLADGARLFLMVACTIAAYYFSWSFSVAVLMLSISSLVGHAILIAIHIVAYNFLIKRQVGL